MVCVDALALSYDRGTRRVLIGLHERRSDPFLGRLALPGVVVRSGERLADAALRALERLGVREAPAALGQLHTFDEPFRDPRGPSLSIAMYAAYPPSVRSDATWVRLDAVPPLAFDHDRIVSVARTILAERLWRDLEFTRALTGSEFTATDAVRISAQLTGRDPHRANLNRDLAKTPGLAEAGIATTSGGRPPKLWRWDPT